MLFLPLAQIDWNSPRAKNFFINLPPEARAKITSHLERHDEADRLHAAKTVARTEDVREFALLKSKIAQEENIKKAFGEKWSPESQFDLDEMKARIERLEAKLRYEPPAPTDKSKINREREFQGLNTPDFNDWQKSFPPNARFAYTPASAKGWTLDKIRAAIDDLIKQRRAIVLLPATLEDAIAAAHASVDKAALQGAPDLGDTVRSGAEVEWPADTFFVKDLSASIQTQYGTSFQCWLNPDAVKKRLETEVRAKFAGRNGISKTERREKLADFDARWLGLQYIEEAVCDAMDAAGKPVARRLLNPLAMLQISRTEDAPEREIVRPQTLETDEPTIGARNWADAEDMPLKGGIGYVPRATTPAAEEVEE